MKRILFIALLSCFVQSLFAQEAITHKLDDLVTAYTAYNKFNGSVLVARQGKVLLKKGYGFKNVQQQSLNDVSTIFQVGSVTKEFTAAVILKLVAQNKLALTDRLSKFYPGFPNADSITIENLLTHTSGLFNYTEIANFWDQLSKPTNEQSVIDSIQKHPLLFLPGEKFSYSNSNYMLLAYIIQKVTSRPYETIVRDWIFKPLNMSQSGFDFTGLESDYKATGYWNFSAAKYTESPLSDSSEYIGGGEMYSTVGDLYKWHHALQSGLVLNKEQQKQAYEPFKGNYGYGWETDTLYNRKIVGHNGRMFGFEARMIRIPEDDLFVILLNNHADKPYLYLLGQKILSILYQQPCKIPEKPLPVSEAIATAYAGIYFADEQHTFGIQLINGHLFGVEGPERMHELFPLKGNKVMFMEEDHEGIFEFLMDENGKVTGFTTISPRGIKLTLSKIR